MRLDVVDIIKGISILMIVNVHLVSGQFFSVGSSFHVIAFFFVAGLVMGLKEVWGSVAVGPFIRRKAAQLLYPYLTLSGCYILFRLVLNLIRGNVCFDSVVTGAMRDTVLFQGVGTLWFFPVLFMGEVIFFLAKKYKVNDIVLILVGVAAVFLASALNQKGYGGVRWYTQFLSAFISVLFMEIGYLSYKHFSSFFANDPISGKRAWTLGGLVVALYGALYYLMRFYRGDLHKLDIGNPFIYLACSLMGLMLVVSASVIFGRYLYKCGAPVKKWGQDSIIIMTTHAEYFITSIVYLAIMKALSVLNIVLDGMILSGLSLAVIMMVEMGVCYVVRHTPLSLLYTKPSRL